LIPQVVVLLAFETDVPRILSHCKKAVDAAGGDFSSYTWITASSSTEDSLTHARAYLAQHPEVEELYEGFLGVSVEMDPASMAYLQVSKELESNYRLGKPVLQQYIVHQRFR
jgi:hypothetical protein